MKGSTTFILGLILFLLIWCLLTLSACVPVALYHYATHDVAGEAEHSDCQRMPETCKQVKP